MLLVDVYHHIGERKAYFRKLREYLNPARRWRSSTSARTRRSARPPASRITEQQVIAEMKEAGYALAATHTFLPNQFYLVFAAR